MSRCNLYLLVNLGCEMLYIIEQRLTAQNIAKDKSAQVLRDVTAALLSPQFFHYVSTAFPDELISMSQVGILLSDIACCSLMRLDPHSLEKLIDLMIMIFKWQLFLMSEPDELLKITLRHLNGIGKLIPEQGKMIQIDQANQFFVSHWNELNEEKHYLLVRKLNKYLAPFNIRISLLIRMKLQVRDGTFIDEAAAANNDFFRYYIKNLGENVYEKMAHFPHCHKSEAKPAITPNTNEINCLFQQFSVDMSCSSAALEEEPRIEPAKEEIVEQRNALDELKKKCKLDLVEEAPPVYEDNFQDLLSMLDGNPT